MRATTAHWANARVDNQGGVSNDTRNRSYDRNMPARISAASLLGFLRAEFIEWPRIAKLDGLGHAELQHDTIRVDLSTLDTLAGLGGLFEGADKCRLAPRARGNFAGTLLPQKRDPAAVRLQAFGTVKFLATEASELRGQARDCRRNFLW